MSYKLEKPFTDMQRADFVCEHQGMNYQEDDNAIYFLEAWETLHNGEIVGLESDESYQAKLSETAEAMQAKKNITKRQLLFWLYQNKQKTETDILTAIDTIQDKDKKYLAQVSYNGTNNFYYGNEYTQLIGQVLGLTTDELKQCFDEANTL